MYAPSDDTFLLADCITQYNGKRALEIGVGSGLLLDILEKNFACVAGSDIDIQALHHCRQQHNNNKKKKKTRAASSSSSNLLLVCCDAGSAFGIGKFDLIVSNPPYLPNDDNNNNLDLTVNGGPTGIETTIHFINSALPLLAEDGKLLVVVSSFANSSALDKLILENNMHKKVIKEKRLFYETLSIVELSL